MNEHNAIVNAMLESNALKAVTNPERLPPMHEYHTPVLGKSDDGYVLLGGLGPLGVGSMWMPEHERHKSYPGYDTAPMMERDS